MVDSQSHPTASSTDDARPDISVMIPVFNEQETIAGVLEQVAEVCSSMTEEYEIVVVDDGSQDATPEVLERMLRRSFGPHLRIVSLTRNFGQHPAMIAGFEACRGERVLTLDADGQSDPRDFSGLIEQLDAGFDVAVGTRVRDADGPFRKAQSAIFNYIIYRLTGTRLRDYGSNFRAYERRVVDAIIAHGDVNALPAVLVAWMGFRIGEIPISHRARSHGGTKYRVLGTTRLIFDLLSGYSEYPMHMISLAGVVCSLGGFFLGAYLLFDRLMFGEAEGFKTVFALLFLLGGLQLLAIGVVGQYLVRVLAEARKRPAYLVRRIVDGGDEAETT